MNNLPDDLQGLFELAVNSTRIRNSEYGSRKDNIELYFWSQGFAQKHQLNPPDMESCGIYYPIEEDEMPAQETTSR